MRDSRTTAPTVRDWIRQSWLRLFSVFRRQQLDREFDAKMSAHLGLAIAENLKSSASQDQARRQAFIPSGGTLQAKQRQREWRGLPVLELLMQDLRFGIRMLGKNPGFTAIAVLTLALGIGANSGIFSVMRQVLLQRLPLPHPEQLVLLYSPSAGRKGHVSSDEVDGSESFSYPMYTDLRDHNTVFAGLAAKADFPVSVALRGQTERASAELVSGNYFDALEVRPAIGRLLLPSDAVTPGSNPVVVLGYGYWRKKYAGDPAVLNQSLLVNNQPMTVVGVLPSGFDGIQPGLVSDVYIPITMKSMITPAWDGLNDHQDYWIKLIGRLKPGISQTQASAALAPTYHALLENELPLNTGLNEQQKKQFVAMQIVLRDGARGRPILMNQTRQQLLTLMGMVGLVLFITCANVAGLLTARGAARQKEIGLRFSLGAGRWRLILQLVIESCLLSMAGALLGLVIANWMSQALVQFASTNEIADGLSASLDIPVLLFTLGLALTCGILFGVAPALSATRVQLASALRGQANSLSPGLTHAHMRKVLVISQVAFTLLLITCAWGFVRSLYNLKNVDLGLQAEHVLQFSVAPQLNGYDQSRSLDLYSQIEDRVAALPGVLSVSGSAQPLIADVDQGSNITVEGEPPELAGTREVQHNAVGAGHFSNLRTALLQGREFRRQDGPQDPKVAIVNEMMAKQFFPNRPALGKRVSFGGGRNHPLDMEIVGIVQNSHHADVKEDPKPFVYVPYRQEKALTSLTFYLRTQGDPAALAATVRQTVGQLDSTLPVYDMRSFEEQIDRSLSSSKLVALLALAFGVLAALLAALGIYGLLAFTVTQRTREIGVRMALGAEPKRVAWMILGDLSRWTGMGIVLGIPLAYALGKLINSLLFGVQAFEGTSVGIALLALTAVVALAAYAPTRRATRIEPTIALRYE